MDLEDRNRTIANELSEISDSYEKLQDCNFELEIEHFNALQDLAILETQLYKYQTECRNYEDKKHSSRNDLKKLQQQNRYYEHIIDCFKHEMTLMSEQLSNLEDILKLSNQSCKEENSQLYNAVLGLQQLSEKLKAQLVDTEKQALIENQRNQIKDARIDELQSIIGQKNADLNVHDVAINEMKNRLDAALLENHELQTSIAALNSTVLQLQCCIQNNEVEKAARALKTKSVSFKRSYSDCGDTDRKSKMRIECLEAALKIAERDLERTKEKSKEKIKNFKRQIDELNGQLASSERTNQCICEQVAKLKAQLTCFNEAECSRDQNLSKSKQVIIEIRQTVIEVHEILADSNLDYLFPAEESSKNKTCGNDEEEIYQNAVCEITVFKKLVENLKDALLDAKHKLSNVETQNKTIKEEIRRKETKIKEIQCQDCSKVEEAKRCIEDLKAKLKTSQAEEKRLSEFIDNLKEEVKRKLEEKQQVQKIVNYCECNTISATQEEITNLKIEIKDMIQNQLALNTENDRLLKQIGCLQCNVSQLEDKTHTLKLKLEKARNDNQCLKEKTRLLQCEKDTVIQTVKNLEAELADAKNNRDDLCAESRHVVNNVKAWLEEQRKINHKVMQKTQCYCDTIAKLKQENESLQMSHALASSTPYKSRYERNMRACTPANCPNLNIKACTPADCPQWTMKKCTPDNCPQLNMKPCTPNDCPQMWFSGSQGTSESRTESPVSCTCSMEEWYSPTYRDDDETEDNEDQFIQKIEQITREMRGSNRRWKNRCQECVVTKDDK